MDKDFKDPSMPVDLEKQKVPPFETVFAQFKDDVYRLSLGLAGNPDDAAEITQEVFLRVYKNLHGFRGESTLRTWIYGIARNTAITYIRKRKIRHMQSLDQQQASSGVAGQENNLVTWLTGEEAKEQIRKAVIKLPAQQREAVTLFYFQGFAVKEIAECMNCSLNKAKVLLYRARKNLFSQLQEWQRELE